MKMILTTWATEFRCHCILLEAFCQGLGDYKKTVSRWLTGVSHLHQHEKSFEKRSRILEIGNVTLKHDIVVRGHMIESSIR